MTWASAECVQVASPGPSISEFGSATLHGFGSWCAGGVGCRAAGVGGVFVPL